MDRETITRLSREAGFADGAPEIVGLEGFARFAALVAEHEREACAKVADDMTLPDWTNEQIAAAIRARSKND